MRFPKNAAIDLVWAALAMQVYAITYSGVYKNAAIGPPYNRVISATQTGPITAFFRKCIYRSVSYECGKTQQKGDKNAAIGWAVVAFIKTRL